MRFGYLTKGLLYGFIGWLAIRGAFGAGGKATDKDGAIREMNHQLPFGEELLIAVAVGLGIYGLWRIAEAIFDPEGRLQHPTEWLVRAGYFLSGLSYAFLAYFAARLAILGNASANKDSWLVKLMSTSWGTAVIVIGGAVIIAVGIHQLYEAVKGHFMERYRLEDMSRGVSLAARVVGSFGLAARSITFFIIGGFAIRAALRSKPGEIKGLAEALQLIARESEGPILLGIVAAGFIAYGLYCLANACYRRLSIAAA